MIDGVGYHGGFDGILHAFDAETGAEVRIQPAEPEAKPTFAIPPSVGGIAPTPWMASVIILVAVNLIIVGSILRRRATHTQEYLLTLRPRQK